MNHHTHQADTHTLEHAGSTPPRTANAASGSRYTCPMHPEIVRDAPGSCPKCGMTLIPMLDSVARPAPAASAAEYTCPMHPEIRRPQPGSCPKCGMALMPIAGT